MRDYLKNLRKLVGHMPILVCGASVIVVNENDEILLQLRRDNKCWGYPGGAVDINEIVEEAAKRELLEEVGITAHSLELFGVFSGKELYYIYPHGDEISNVDIVYICKNYAGEAQADLMECEDAKFFSVDNLPDNISPPCVPALKKYKEIYGKNSDLIITYKQLNIDDIHPNILNDFNRYQEVTKCWRKQNDEWILVDNRFIDDWDEAKKKELAIVYLPGTIERGGTVFGAFDGEKLIGFFALAGNLIGSRKQYIRLISLQVSYEYRHKGIGKKLFALCVDAAKKFGAEKMYISAHSSQESQAFYRAMKCVETEEIIPELFEIEPFDVHMEYILAEKERSV